MDILGSPNNPPAEHLVVEERLSAIEQAVKNTPGPADENATASQEMLLEVLDETKKELQNCTVMYHASRQAWEDFFGVTNGTVQPSEHITVKEPLSKMGGNLGCIARTLESHNSRMQRTPTEDQDESDLTAMFVEAVEDAKKEIKDCAEKYLQARREWNSLAGARSMWEVPGTSKLKR